MLLIKLYISKDVYYRKPPPSQKTFQSPASSSALANLQFFSLHSTTWISWEPLIIGRVCVPLGNQYLFCATPNIFWKSLSDTYHSLILQLSSISPNIVLTSFRIYNSEIEYIMLHYALITINRAHNPPIGFGPKSCRWHFLTESARKNIPSE